MITETTIEKTPWMNLREASRYAGISDQVLRRWIHSGGLPASRAGEVSIRIHREDLDAWLRSRPAAGPAPNRDGTRHGKKTGPGARN